MTFHNLLTSLNALFNTYSALHFHFLLYAFPLSAILTFTFCILLPTNHFHFPISSCSTVTLKYEFPLFLFLIFFYTLRSCLSVYISRLFFAVVWIAGCRKVSRKLAGCEEENGTILALCKDSKSFTFIMELSVSDMCILKFYSYTTVWFSLFFGHNCIWYKIAINLSCELKSLVLSSSWNAVFGRVVTNVKAIPRLVGHGQHFLEAIFNLDASN